MPEVINLYSDTATTPSPGMRRAMAEAEVGDEQLRADPTVNRLCERVAELLGTERAMFLPTGTICNQIALRVHCEPGDEVILEETAHNRHYETGAAAALLGVSLYPVAGDRGVFLPDQLLEAIRVPGNHFPRSRAVLIEQTANLAGGTVWPIETLEAVCRTAAQHGLRRHLDGARLLNAVVSAGVSADRYCRAFDSVWIDFSKGLGAPVGAALAGSAQFIERAWRFKHQFGAAMRQAGIIAAGALYALDHNIERLQQDHENASELAAGLARLSALVVEAPATNMVFFRTTPDAIGTAELADRLRDRGVLLSLMSDGRLRAVTHLDIGRADIVRTLDIVQNCVA